MKEDNAVPIPKSTREIVFHSSLDDPKPTIAEMRDDLDRRIREVEQAEAAQRMAEERERERLEEERMEQFDRERKARIAAAADILTAKTGELAVKKHDYSQELDQVAKAAGPLLQTLKGYVKEYTPILSPLQEVNQAQLSKFLDPSKPSYLIATTLWRRLAEVQGILTSTVSALESLPKRTKQIHNMIGLSPNPEVRYVNDLKKELGQHRDSVEAVPGMVRSITQLAERLAVLLQHAGPLSTWQPVPPPPANPDVIVVENDPKAGMF